MQFLCLSFSTKIVLDEDVLIVARCMFPLLYIIFSCCSWERWASRALQKYLGSFSDLVFKIPGSYSDPCRPAAAARTVFTNPSNASASSAPVSLNFRGLLSLGGSIEPES